VDERASPTVGLFVRLDPRLHDDIRRAAAAHEETITRLVQRALSHELERQRAGHQVADAIRKASRRSGISSRTLTSR
jgi:hypothetical protein